MEADTLRRIKSGKEFDHLFPRPTGNDYRKSGKADVEDTLKLIRRTVPQTLWQTEKIAKILRGRTLDETCSNIWHFVFEHIQYKKDQDGVEQVRSPRRTWWERGTGVDCDCYTEFISSILLNLGIPHKARITKYHKEPPEVPRWQHIYPVVPRDGRLNYNLEDRNSYIVIDCVKDEYDDEQRFLEAKDYDMKLDYLDGIDEDEQVSGDFDWPEPDSVDGADLQTMDEDELGNIFKKIGKGIKKVTKKVGSGVKTVAKKVGTTAKTVAKKVGNVVGEGIRFINRYAFPPTILLRNGFLLAMKANLLNVAGRLRYAYLSDAEAQKRGMNMDALKKLRWVKDRAETVYWQAGGKKANLKKGILKGKGNKKNPVPLSGLGGLDDNVYMDLDEYNIIHSDADTLEGLGEIASGAAITAASGAVAAIAASLKQIKALFSKGGQEEQAFQSETDNAGNAYSPEAVLTAEDQQIRAENEPEPMTTYPASIQQRTVTSSPSTQQRTATSYSPPVPSAQQQTQAITQYETQAEYSDGENGSESDQSAIPGATAFARRAPDGPPATTESLTIPAKTGNENSQGFMEKSTAWVKENPGKTVLIAGAVVGAGFMLIKAARPKPNTNGMSGLPGKGKRKRKKNKNRQKHKIESITL